MTVWVEIGSRLREIAEGGAGSKRRPGPQRFTVVGVTPLVLDEVLGSERLEQGDPDFEVDDRVLTEAALGDIAIVHQDVDGDYLATALVKEEN